jgi:hypothetical protein
MLKNNLRQLERLWHHIHLIILISTISQCGSDYVFRELYLGLSDLLIILFIKFQFSSKEDIMKCKLKINHF